MPEIKHSFTTGRMNKDLDERVLPNGEYRDAMNIQIRTTDSGGASNGVGDAGVIQNIPGNVVVGETALLTKDNLFTLTEESTTIVGSVADDKNDTAYFFVSAPTYTGYSGEELSGLDEIETWADYIVQQHVDGTMTYVIVDRFITAGNIGAVFAEAMFNPSNTAQGWTSLNILPQTASNYIPGMEIGVFDEDGFHLLINENGEPDWVLVQDVISNNNANENDTIVLNTSQTLGLGGAVGVIFKMPEEKRLLNLSPNRYITGINVINNLLFWTDNHNEPKKINIDKSILGTNPIDLSSGQALVNDGTRHSLLYVTNPLTGDIVPVTDLEPGLDNAYLKKENITVIRKAPKQAPNIVMRGTTRSGTTTFNISHSFNTINPETGISMLPLVGDEQTIMVEEEVDILAGDLLTFTNFDQNEAITITAAVLNLTSEIGGTEISVKLTNVNSNVTSVITNWEANLQTSKPLFELQLGRFAYRYRYDDNEYSTFSPWSELAFLPGKFLYNAKNGYNVGMTNNVRMLTISDFIPPDILRPSDVKTIDILFKTTNDQNVYVVRTITREIDNEWELFTSEQGDNTGSIVLTSEMIHKSLPSNQLIRAWDNVPRKALSQEISGSRLIYGNYTQGYDINQSVGLEQILFSEEVPALMPVKSVKSLRSYKFGMVFGDEYGRETPVIASSITSGEAGDALTITGDVAIGKEYCGKSNKFILTQVWQNQSPPSWIDYVKYYVKETSSEYHNLVMDRWYDAEDGNVWLAFPSADRNKVDLETYLILKNGHGDQNPVLENARYKIIAIENEAPDYIKRDGRRMDMIRIPNSIVYNNAAYGVDNIQQNIGNGGDPSGVPDGLIGRRKILLGSNEFNDAGLDKGAFKGDTNYGRIVAEYRPGNTAAIQNDFAGDDQVQGGWLQAPVEATYKTGWKKIGRLIDGAQGTTSRGVVMSETFGNEANAYLHFTQTLGVTIDTADTECVDITYFLEFKDEHIESAPRFDGRFFVKIEKDATLSQNVLHEYSGDYIIEDQFEVTYISNSGFNPANSNAVNGGTATAGSAWNVNGYFDYGGTSLAPQTAWSSNQQRVSDYWNAWHAHPNRKADIFIDATPAYNVIDAFGWTVDNGFGQGLFNVQGGTTLFVDNWNDAVAIATTSGGANSPDGFEINTDISYSGGWYIPGGVPNSGELKGFNSVMTYAEPNANQGALMSPSGMFNELTFSVLGGWNTPGIGGANNSLFRGHMMTPGTRFRFANDPTDNVYEVDNTSFILEMSDDYAYATGGMGNVTMYETVGVPFNVPGPLKNHGLNEGLIGDIRSTIIVRFGRVTGSETFEPGQGINSNLWDPRGLLYHNGVADDDGNYGSIQIQILRSNDEDNLSNENSLTEGACWETEPKKSADLDIYYEASNAIPVRLTTESIVQYTQPKTKVAVPARVNVIRNVIDLSTQQPVASPIYPNPVYVNDTNGPRCIELLCDQNNDGTPTGVTDLLIGDTLEFKHNDGTITRSNVEAIATIDDNGVAVVDDNGGGVTVNGFGWGSSNTGVNYLIISGQDVEVLGIEEGMQVTGDIISGPCQVLVVYYNPGGALTIVAITPFSVNTFSSWLNPVAVPITFSNGPTDGWYRIDQDVYNYPIQLNWFNCYSFGNGVESNRIRDDFNAPTIDNGIKASTTFLEYKEEVRGSGMIYSGLYNSNSSVNDLNQFNMGEKITKDLNPAYGSIQRLKTRDTDVITFCEDKILKVLANKDAVFNAEGNPNLTATDRVLGQTIPFVGDYGISKNPESLAWDNFRMYFTDKQRGAVLRLSRDGLTPISNVGMKTWFNDKLRTTKSIIGSFDAFNGEYNITLAYKDEEIDFDVDEPILFNTISFNEVAKGWVSFKSYSHSTGLSVAGRYLTGLGNRIFEHNRSDVNRNTFNGQFAESTVDIIFNDRPDTVKSFNSINYEGSQSRVSQFLDFSIQDKAGNWLNNLSDGEYYNLNNNRGWYVDTPSEIKTDLNAGRVSDFIKKEGKWFSYISGNLFQDTDSTLDAFINEEESTVQGIGLATNITDPDVVNINQSLVIQDSDDWDGPWSMFTFMNSQSIGNSPWGIKHQSILDSYVHETGDTITFTFGIYLRSTLGLTSEYWPSSSPLTVEIGGVEANLMNYFGGNNTTISLSRDTHYTTTWQVNITDPGGVYDNKIKINFATNNGEVAQANAAIIFYNAHVGVVGSDGSVKLNKTVDLTNIIGADQNPLGLGENIWMVNNVGTNQFPHIDGWRENSVNGNVAYITTSNFPNY